MYDEQHIPKAHLVGYLDGKAYDRTGDGSGSSTELTKQKLIIRDEYFEHKQQTAFVATFRSHTWLMTMFASCLGPGMLSGFVVPMIGSETEKQLSEEEEKMKKALADVSGIVTIDLRPSESGADLQDLAVDERSVPGAGILILMKICGALVASGYDQETVVKVGRLVSRNLITAATWDVEIGDEASESREPVSTKNLSEDVILQQVQNMLKNLLDPTKQRPRHVNVNSNEPVLLINVEHKANKTTRDRLVEATIDTLHKDWNIWPVRIYVYTMFAALEPTFSITLLNVVNTDIGGPSMVQLLDMPCDVPEWNQFLRRESWRDRNLISKEESQMQDALHHSSSESEEGSLSSSILSSALAEEDESQIESAAVEDTEELQYEHDDPNASRRLGDIDQAVGASITKEASAPQGGEQISDNSELPEPLDSGSPPDELKRSAMIRSPTEKSPIPESIPERSKDAEVFSFDERDIQHPTWEHSTKSESLADLIRSQAAKLGFTAPANDEAGSDNESVETDEGFELVRAP